MQFNSFIEKAIKIKHLELLGELSHAKLSPPFRLKLVKQMKDKVKHAKKAGVLILFYPSETNEVNVVFILRKSYKGVHSAQVAFPGGKIEETDNNLQETALRETEEEVGVPQNLIKIIAPISPIYIPPSNFMVHPYVGYVNQQPTFIKQEDEVEAILEIPITAILNNDNIINTAVQTSYSIKVNVPAFNLNNHIVWGATAMMLSELKDLLKQVL